MIRRTLAIVRKEFQQVRRDRKMMAVILVAPVLQLIFLGYAANMDVKLIPMAVWDCDNSQTSRSYIQKLVASGYFYYDYRVDNYQQIEELIDKSKILLAIVIPPKFEEMLNRNSKPKIQVILDGSNGNKASIVFGYLMNITSGFAKNILFKEIQAKGYPKYNMQIVSAETRVFYNSEMITRVYLLPGILALILLIITVPLTSMSIVREKEIGTFEQLIITPVRSTEIILGKVVPFAIIGLFEFLLVTIVMRYWFGIEIRGSFGLLLLCSFVFVLSNLGIGIFVSTFSKTQQQAMMVSVFAFMIPMIYLSGFVFPIHNMPKIIQFITYFIPLRYYLVIIRGIVLKGIGANILFPQILVLTLFAILLFAISIIKFQKKLT